MRKYISQELFIALGLDVLILFFASIITADLNDARGMQIVFGCAFILMIIITVVAYKEYQRRTPSR